MVRQIGLTGGIASGKSAVAECLAELGAVIIDSDVLAREVVQPGTPGLAAVADRFGPGVLAADGSLDRAALGAVVFADPQARADLEAIIHPAVRARASALSAAAPADAVVVQVIPLLVEAGLVDAFDQVVVVDVDPDLQMERLQRRNGYSREEAAARVAAQAPRDVRLAQADVVIENNGTLTELVAKVDRFWAELMGVDTPGD
jgi:dephospho-CoA kinase